MIGPARTGNTHDDADGIWAGYDAALVRDALDRSAGAFARSGGVSLKEDVLAARGQDSRGRPA
jgi:hypothetical protein